MTPATERRQRQIRNARSVISEAEFWERFGSEETSTIEFKQSLPKPNRLQEPVVAFANARGGTILIGVVEARPRTIAGTVWGQSCEESVQETARMTHPPLPIRTETLSVDGKTVALLHVAELGEGAAQTSDGRTIVRAGPTNRALVQLELVRFLLERSSDPAEDQAVRRAALGDLSADLVRVFLRKRLGKSRISVEAGLRDLGFLAPDGRVRLAALLLFGKQPQAPNRRFGIDVIRFEGTTTGRPVLRERRQLNGPLPELVAQADQMIYEEMRRDAVVRGLVREEVPEFPPLALREALLNAVGHRDYSQRGSAVQVRLYDDAIEIESPGSLAGYVTVENLRDAQYSRNERLMDAFGVLGLVEEAGTGIDRMYAEMEDALLDPPQFEERAGSFVVRFSGRSVFTAEDRLWASRFYDLHLTADEKIALVYARRQGAVTNEVLRGLRGLASTDARSALQRLVVRELLTPIGRGRGTQYVLSGEALAPRRANLDEQLRSVVAHAQRAGTMVNSDVRGLLGIDSAEARRLLEAAVTRGYLTAMGERRGRRYLPTLQATDALE